MIFRNRSILYLSIIILINLIIKILFLQNIDLNILNFSDQTKYIRISQHLLDKGFFEPNQTLNHRSPLYPFFIYFLRKIFDSLYFVVIIQNILSSLLIVITYNLSKLVYKENAFLITFIFSINLNIILHTNLILTEAIFIPFFIIFLYFSIKFLKKERAKDLIFASIILGICALIRPQINYFPVVMFFVIFLFLDKPFLKKLKFYLIFFLIFKCFTFAWETRNYIVHGKFFFEASKRTNLIGYYLPHFDQYEYNLSLADAKNNRAQLWAKYLKKNNYDNEDFVSIEKIAITYSLKEMKEYRIDSLFKAMSFGLLKNIFTPTFSDMSYWFHWEKTSFSSTKGNNFFEQFINFLIENKNNNFFNIFLISLIILFISRVFEIYGFINFFKKDIKLNLYFLLIIAYFLILIGPIGHAKYRIPLEFFFSVYLSIGLKNIFFLRKKLFNNRNI